MYMRLAFAVAAHLEPEILMVDEVLAVGDAGFQRKCLGKMGEVAKEGRTVLFVSHNMATIQRLCHSALLLGQRPNRPPVEQCRTLSSITSSRVAPPVQQWERSRPADDATSTFSGSTSLMRLAERIEHVTTAGRAHSRDGICRSAALSQSAGQRGSPGRSGDLIFASNPQDVGVEIPEQPGQYRAVVSLPPQILLPKLYGIERTSGSPGMACWIPWIAFDLRCMRWPR